MPQFDIEGARKAGYSEDEILSHLTQSRKFDIEGARAAGYSNDEIIQHLSGTAPTAGFQVGDPNYKPGPLGQVMTSVNSALAGLTLPFRDPVGMVKGMAMAPVEQGRKAVEEFKAGDYGSATARGLALVTPGMGPAAINLVEKATTGERPFEAAADVALMSLPGVPKLGRAASRGVRAAESAVGMTPGTTGRLATAPGRFMVRGATDMIGKATGAGGESLRIAATTSSERFKDAMRSRVSEMEIVSDLKGAVQELAHQRSEAYQQALGALDQTIMGDMAPVRAELLQQFKNYRIAPSGNRMFAQTPLVNKSDHSLIMQAMADIGRWSDLSPSGLDTLKRRLAQYGESASPQAQPLFYKVADTVRSQLEKNVPGYQQMTADYAKATEFIKEINKEFAAGPNAHPGNSIRRLNYSLNQNNEYRSMLLEMLDRAANTELKETMAGYSLKNLTPRGLQSVLASSPIAVGAAFFNPKLAAGYLFASPRAMGETMALLSTLRRGAQRVAPAAGAAIPTGAVINLNLPGMEPEP